MSTTPRWLDETEQAVWRSLLKVMRLLPAHLEDRLHERYGLSMTDYQVMVEVSESAEHRLRMTELAQRTQLSKSRLSHQIGRMEQVGLVLRTQCPDDRRGQWAELTEAGWALLREAAPEHVEDVRELFFDQLTPEQVRVLADAYRKVAAGLEKSPATGCANARAEAECAEAAYAEAEAAAAG
jgi:DNA-binding MarR family transcriptional regulator